MLKAILYYILFLAEYLITIFLGGFLVGLYMAMNMDSGSHSQQIGALKESVYPFIIVIGFLGILIVWFTFGHYKFSKFSLGKVIPAAKWKAMTICTMPILGFTKVFYPEASNIVIFVVMAVVLLIKPAGLFGREK